MADNHRYTELNGTEHQWIDAACAEIATLIHSDNLDVDAIIKSISALKASMLLHYAEEESIMTKVNFSGAGAHRRAHDYFLSEVSELLELVDDRSASALRTKWHELNAKFDNHVRTHDENLMVHLRLTAV